MIRACGASSWINATIRTLQRLEQLAVQPGREKQAALAAVVIDHFGDLHVGPDRLQLLAIQLILDCENLVEQRGSEFAVGQHIDQEDVGAAQHAGHLEEAAGHGPVGNDGPVGLFEEPLRPVTKTAGAHRIRAIGPRIEVEILYIGLRGAGGRRQP